MQVDLNSKKILITGATGTLGKILIKRLLKNFPRIERLVVFSRDEYKQSQLSRRYADTQLEFVIGDVRDKVRLMKTLAGIDIVIHAAAMKYLDICERNPEETFKTNVDGTNNLIEAARFNEVKKVVFISTDKAVEPISVYGHSKAKAEENIMKAATSSTVEFVILRLGNIFNSRGSVFDVFREYAKNGELTVFDKRSTRYLIKEKQLYKSIIHSLSNELNGIIIIPKLKIFKVYELAIAYCKDCNIIEKPVRNAERVHEFLFSEQELIDCYEDEKYFYVIKDKESINTIGNQLKINKVAVNQPLSSETGIFFGLADLKKMITKN